MNAYEWKQEQRKIRLERAAERARSDADSAFQGAHDAVAGIPFGQPILVGHHSEKRHRRALQRCDDRMRKGFTRLKEAEELSRRAGAVGSAGISSDDPDAVTKLDGKASDLIAKRDRMKAINTAYRKAKGAKGWSEGLEITKDEANEIASAFRFGLAKQPYPSYALQNIGARIRDAAKRATEIAARPVDAESASYMAAGAEIVENPSENRVELRFAQRLSRDHYKLVRSHGFVWAPSRDAFVRKLNDYAVRLAGDLAYKLGAA